MSASFSELVHSLRGAQWRNDPYFWAVVDEFVSPGFAERLAATIPAAGFSASERPSGDPGHRKPYRLESKALNAEDDDKYTPAWRDFLRALRSSEYRTAMSEVIGIDLSGLNLELSLWHYPPGDGSARIRISRTRSSPRFSISIRAGSANGAAAFVSWDQTKRRTSLPKYRQS